MGNRLLPSWLSPRIRDVVPESFYVARGRIGGANRWAKMSDKERLAFSRAGGLATAAALGPEGRRALGVKAWAGRQRVEWSTHFPTLLSVPPIPHRMFLVLRFYGATAGAAWGSEAVRQLAGSLSMGHVYGVQRSLLASGYLVRVQGPKGASKLFALTDSGRALLASVLVQLGVSDG